MKLKIHFNYCPKLLAVTVLVLSYLHHSFAMAETSANQGNQVDTQTQRVEIQEKISVLLKLSSSEFQAQYLQLRREVDTFIDHKKLECMGEFTTLVMNDLGEMERVKRQLTREEKKTCVYDLKSFHIFYLEKVVEARKIFYEKLHVEQMSLLKTQRDQMLNELEKTYKNLEKEIVRIR
jgi:hypothetical protein